MSEGQKPSQQEVNPPTPEQMLGEFGLTPDVLKKARVLVFAGLEPLVGNIAEAKVQAFDEDYFWDTDKVVPDGEPINYALAKNGGTLSTYISRPNLLAAWEQTFNALTPDGQIRLTGSKEHPLLPDDHLNIAGALYNALSEPGKISDVHGEYVGENTPHPYIIIDKKPV